MSGCHEDGLRLQPGPTFKECRLSKVLSADPNQEDGEPDLKAIYFFDEGDASMKNLLGGKGAGLAEMTRAGLPVPPGFTITTKQCLAYYGGSTALPDGLSE